MINTTDIGITDKAFELYSILLKNGLSTVGYLIKQSGYKRATVYKNLYSLESIGLITKIDVKKVINFKAEPPKKLLELAEKKYIDTRRVLSDIEGLLPDLNSDYILSTEKPIVTTFEGVKGLKKIYEDMLSEKKEIFAILQPSIVEPELFNWLNKNFFKRRKKLGIRVNALVSTGSWSTDYVKQTEKDDIGKTRLVSSQKYPFKLEMDIFGDKVAFINYKKGEPLIGIIIHNPFIAKTMKATFDLAWLGAADS